MIIAITKLNLKLNLLHQNTEIIIIRLHIAKKVNYLFLGNLKFLSITKESKLPVPWESKIPKHYKPNTILGELDHAQKISSNFQKEVKNIK